VHDKTLKTDWHWVNYIKMRCRYCCQQ